MDSERVLSLLDTLEDTPSEIIRTISYSQDDLLRSIIQLHTGPLECDATYGNGNFYRTLPRPRLCFDLAPRQPDVVQADARALPLPDESLYNLVLDPPFMARTGPGATLKERFGEVMGTIYALWDLYGDMLREAHRVLRPLGHCVFKCQDGVLSGINNFTHVELMMKAIHAGFHPKDLFVLLAAHRMMHPEHKVQVHARKFHSYFWVFQKIPPRVRYTGGPQ